MCCKAHTAKFCRKAHMHTYMHVHAQPEKIRRYRVWKGNDWRLIHPKCWKAFDRWRGATIKQPKDLKSINEEELEEVKGGGLEGGVLQELMWGPFKGEGNLV